MSVRPLPLHITTVGRFNACAILSRFVVGTASIGGVTWAANNRAVYTPVFLPQPFTVARFIVANSNTTGNVDVGIYNDAGKLLLSTGSTARSGTNVSQYFDVTNTKFLAGLYYLALLCSSTSGSVQRAPVINQYEARMIGLLQEDLGATALPATMTPVSYTDLNLFCYGFTQSDTL